MPVASPGERDRGDARRTTGTSLAPLAPAGGSIRTGAWLGPGHCRPRPGQPGWSAAIGSHAAGAPWAPRGCRARAPCRHGYAARWHPNAGPRRNSHYSSRHPQRDCWVGCVSMVVARSGAVCIRLRWAPAAQVREWFGRCPVPMQPLGHEADHNLLEYLSLDRARVLSGLARLTGFSS